MIEVGKIYKTKNGLWVEVIEHDGSEDSSFPYVANLYRNRSLDKKFLVDRGCCYTSAGQRHYSGDQKTEIDFDYKDDSETITATTIWKV